MAEVEDARELLRRRLGADWEARLMQADAMPRRRVTSKQTDAAEQRAIDLAKEACEFWTPEIDAAVAAAWRVLTARAR